MDNLFSALFLGLGSFSWTNTYPGAFFGETFRHTTAGTGAVLLCSVSWNWHSCVTARIIVRVSSRTVTTSSSLRLNTPVRIRSIITVPGSMTFSVGIAIRIYGPLCSIGFTPSSVIRVVVSSRSITVRIAFLIVRIQRCLSLSPVIGTLFQAT